jgi:hypothetical protein
MPLSNPEKKGLHGFKLRNKSNDVIKASVVIPAGDELEVSEDVARQLTNQSTGFESNHEVPARSTATDEHPEAAEVENAGGGSARERSGRRGR